MQHTFSRKDGLARQTEFPLLDVFIYREIDHLKHCP